MRIRDNITPLSWATMADVNPGDVVLDEEGDYLLVLAERDSYGHSKVANLETGAVHAPSSDWHVTPVNGEFVRSA